MRKRIYKNCPICNNQMDAQSNLCRDCYLQKRRKPESYINKECPVCKKFFTTHKSQIERGQGKYCSRRCARKGSPTRKRIRIMLKCFVCGKSFERHKSEIKKSIGDKRFCSLNCWYQHNQLENHYGWTGGQDERINPSSSKWRAAVLKRDKYFCRICHSNKHLNVHHVIRFGKDKNKRWNVDNGLTLCDTCHKKFRNREEEYEDVLSFIASVPVEVWYV